MKISSKVKEMMNEKNCSAREFAKIYQTSNTRISDIVAGKMDNPSVSVTLNLMNLFGWSLSEVKDMLPSKDDDFYDSLSEKLDPSEKYDEIISEFVDWYFDDRVYEFFDNDYDDIEIEDTKLDDKGENGVIDITFNNINGHDVNLPGYNAILTLTSKQLVQIPLDEADEYQIEIKGAMINGEDCYYEVAYEEIKESKEMLLYYLPFRRIRNSGNVYVDEYIRDFTNKFLYLITHDELMYDSYIFFTTSKKLYELIKQLFSHTKKRFKADPIKLVYMDRDRINSFEEIDL